MRLRADEQIDEILSSIKDALELAREKDEPRDMEIRFLLSLVIDKLEAFRYDTLSEI
jgi:hypothetical protein